MPAGRWQKGQSGNPRGRAKKGETFRDILYNELKHRVVALDEDGNPLLDEEGREIRIAKKKAIVLKMLDMCMNGNEAMLRYVMDQLDGKADVYQYVMMGTQDLTDLTPEERKQRISELLARRKSDDDDGEAADD